MLYKQVFKGAPQWHIKLPPRLTYIFVYFLPMKYQGWLGLLLYFQDQIFGYVILKKKYTVEN